LKSQKSAAKILYIVIFLFATAYTSITFGETLYFGVSPFDTTYGLIARYDFSFWKFNTKFKLDIPIDQKRGIIYINPDFSNMIDYFQFDDYPYKVTYTTFNGDIPFTTFINPASKTWHSTWVNTGYYGDYLIHQDDMLSILGNSEAVSISFKTKWADIFLERIGDGFNFGVGKNIYAFYGTRTGIGGTFSTDNFLVYATGYTDSSASNTTNNAINIDFGFSVKIDNLTMNIVKDQKSGATIWNASWKVGDMYVTGRCKGKEIRLDFEFPIW
jgi:hypothetical protein